MFGILSSLAKATVGVVIETPLALAADVLTLGGVVNDRHEPYTATAVKKVAENVADATDPNRE